MTDDCALCGLPVERGALGEGGVLLHHGGELTIPVGEEHGFGGCRPILTSCFSAWTFYGYRSVDDDPDDVSEFGIDYTGDGA